VTEENGRPRKPTQNEHEAWLRVCRENLQHPNETFRAYIDRLLKIVEGQEKGK